MGGHRGVGGQFVHGGRGPLGQQEEDRPQGGKHEVARQGGEHRPGRQVAGQHDQRVAAVLALAVLSRRGVTAVPGRGLDVVEHGVGHHPHPVSGRLHPPAEVGVLPEQPHPRVETADLLPHVAAGQHPGAAHGEHVAIAVVLALVHLAWLDAGDPAPCPVDGGTCLQQDLAVGPVHEPREERDSDHQRLAPAHRRRRCLPRPGQQLLKRIRGWLTVVVQQPDPLGAVFPGGARQRHVGVGRPVAQRLGDRGSIPRAAFHAEHRRPAERLGEHRSAAIGAAGVHGHDPLHRPGLLRHGIHDTRKPRGAVVGDNHHGDDVWAVRAVW